MSASLQRTLALLEEKGARLEQAQEETRVVEAKLAQVLIIGFFLF